MTNLRLKKMALKEGFLVHNINWIHHLDCSGISGSPPPYKTLSGDVKGATYGSSLSRHDASTPIIFCVHGNKFGMARCCDDLHAGTDDENQENRAQHGESGTINNRTNSVNSTGASDNSKSILICILDYLSPLILFWGNKKIT